MNLSKLTNWRHTNNVTLLNCKIGNDSDIIDDTGFLKGRVHAICEIQHLEAGRVRAAKSSRHPLAPNEFVHGLGKILPA